MRNPSPKICYFQGCGRVAKTREHIPPKAFFLSDKRARLLTVPSCEVHNNCKSKDDLYVLAQVLINVSPAGRARELFQIRILPQLKHGNGALAKMLMKRAAPLFGGGVAYDVDMNRLDSFFTGLSCGIIYKVAGAPLPGNYEIQHIYCNLEHADQSSGIPDVESLIERFYSAAPSDVLRFGDPKTCNDDVYKVKIFGDPNFQTSITQVHEFYEKFRVISMLTRLFDGQGTGHGA